MESSFFPLSDFLAPVPEPIRQALNAVRHFLRHEYGARCRIVGGAVRDRLLGRPVEDLDLEVYGMEPEPFAEAMERLGADGVGKSFFVYKLGHLDIALPRVERKVGRGHRGFAVEPARDEREASRRRDFTVNALLYDPEEERILDYWGGLEDLRDRRLRCVDPATFVEDSLRVLRGMQFAARLGFRVEEETCRLCRGIDLSDLPGARIFGEFEKMFYGAWPHYGLYALESLGISRRLWGAGLSRKGFTAAARKMARWRDAAPELFVPYGFLTIYRQYAGVSMEKILEAIDAPNRYRRSLERLEKLPERLSPSFVAGLALKEGVRGHPYRIAPELREMAKELGVWERPFDPGVSPRELMERGMRGRALGAELERVRREALERLDRKRRKEEKG
jgi:tRNA nucleotidyltransferase (CCA-adding enzyme)